MIVRQLEAFRIKQGLTNEELAKMLNIHLMSWYRIKRIGKFNAKFLLNAQKILSSNVPPGDENVMPKLHQTPPSGQQGGYFGKVIRGILCRFRRLSNRLKNSEIIFPVIVFLAVAPALGKPVFFISFLLLGRGGSS